LLRDFIGRRVRRPTFRVRNLGRGLSGPRVQPEQARFALPNL
jgi:hypothetical protein